MFPQAELIGFPNVNFCLNSNEESKTISGVITTNGTNQWWDSTSWDPNYPYKPSVASPTVIPFTLPVVPGTITIYPPLPIGPESWPGLPGTEGPPGVIGTQDPDIEIVVLPKDPMKKKEALRELLKDKVDEPVDEREGRRIDLGGEED